MKPAMRSNKTQRAHQLSIALKQAPKPHEMSNALLQDPIPHKMSNELKQDSKTPLYKHCTQITPKDPKKRALCSNKKDPKTL